MNPQSTPVIARPRRGCGGQRLWLALALAFALLPGCRPPPPQIIKISGAAQGSSYHIQWWSTGAVDRAAMQLAVDQELARLDRLLSNYRADSRIERFNASAALAAFDTGPEIVRLVAMAKQITTASDACYDLSSKPLYDLWGFRGPSPAPPAAAELAAALRRVGMDKLRIVDATHLQKLDAGLSLDLASIAQGYSIERLAALLEASGSVDYLVELGGEMLVRGSRPDGRDWQVAIERPLPGTTRFDHRLAIHGEPAIAVMTSGSYRHFFEKDGRRYGHVLDPRLGAPVSHDTVAVTVLHQDASAADAWSTALLCLGAERGLLVAEREQLAALFVSARAGGLVEVHTRRWPQPPPD